MRTLLSVLLFIALMGPLGKTGLSQITSIDISGGYYHYQDREVHVWAIGKDRHGVEWQIIAIWENGWPTLLLKIKPKVGL